MPSGFLLLLWMVLIASFTSVQAAEMWPGETLDAWHGYVRHNFTVEGCPAWVVEPKQAAPGNPWTWCMEFPDALTERTGVLQLLEKGFHHAYISVGNTFGCPAAVKHLEAFYQILRAGGLAPKATYRLPFTGPSLQNAASESKRLPMGRAGTCSRFLLALIMIRWDVPGTCSVLKV